MLDNGDMSVIRLSVSWLTHTLKVVRCIVYSSPAISLIPSSGAANSVSPKMSKSVIPLVDLSRATRTSDCKLGSRITTTTGTLISTGVEVDSGTGSSGMVFSTTPSSSAEQANNTVPTNRSIRNATRRNTTSSKTPGSSSIEPLQLGKPRYIHDIHKLPMRERHSFTRSYLAPHTRIAAESA